MSDPDYIYDVDNWETTYPWDCRHDMVEDVSLWYEDIREFGTLINGPSKWVVNVVLSWDDTGDPDETEIRWFDTKEEAEKALADSLKGREICSSD